MLGEQPAARSVGGAQYEASDAIRAIEEADELGLPAHERLERLKALPFNFSLQWDERSMSAEHLAEGLGIALSQRGVYHLRLESIGGLPSPDLRQVNRFERWPVIALAPFHQLDCSKLLALSLSGLPLAGGNALSPLSELNNLRSLKVEDSPMLPTPALRRLINLTRLELVSFNGCTQLGDQCVGFLLPFQRLRSLQLDGTSVGDTALLVATIFPHLAHLDFNSSAVSDLGLKILAKRGASLTEVGAARCSSITDAGLVALAALPRLRYVDVTGCSSISPSALSLFRAKRPECDVHIADAPNPSQLFTSTPTRTFSNARDSSPRLSEFMVERSPTNLMNVMSAHGGSEVINAAGAPSAEWTAASRPQHFHQAQGGPAMISLNDPRRRPVRHASGASPDDPRLAKQPRLHHQMSPQMSAAVAALRPQQYQRGP